MRRWLCALFASVVVNFFAWVVLPQYLARSHNAEEEEHPERLTVSTVLIHVQRRPVHHPPPEAEASSEGQSAMLAPPPPASLSLPAHWMRQDFGYVGTTQMATWMDGSKQRGSWMPRVFLWAWKMEAGYMSRPSLQDGVQKILATLHGENAKIYSSSAQQVCNGRRAGWFLSYVKPGDEPPLHFDEALYMAGDTIYRAIYIRAVGQSEDAKTRDSLTTLCWP